MAPLLAPFFSAVARSVPVTCNAGARPQSIPVAAVMTKVKAKEKDILDGKFKVPVVETEPKSTAK